jgi:hypothetical protein
MRYGPAVRGFVRAGPGSGSAVASLSRGYPGPLLCRHVLCFMGLRQSSHEGPCRPLATGRRHRVFLDVWLWRRLMTDLITEIWSGLNDAGLPEVMLYLPDGAAYRCHWDDTALVGEVRVALLADQDRKIVRIVPVDQCQGIGIASPKGTDPAGYRAVVRAKLDDRFPARMAAVATP